MSSKRTVTSKFTLSDLTCLCSSAHIDAIMAKMRIEKKSLSPQSTPAPVGNRLLARLPEAEYQRLLPHLEHVFLSLGEVIYESGGQQSFIYFPTTAIISLLYMMQNSSSAEMGVAGNEGLVGIALFM